MDKFIQFQFSSYLGLGELHHVDGHVVEEREAVGEQPRVLHKAG